MQSGGRHQPVWAIRFARDDKREGSASMDEGDWDGRVRCAASLERDLSIRITKPNENVKSKFVIPSEPGFPATLQWTQPRVRFSVGENRMKSVNANKINRKSGEAEGSAVRPGWLLKASGSHTRSEAQFSFIFSLRHNKTKTHHPRKIRPFSAAPHFLSRRIRCRYRFAWATSRMICSFNASGVGQRRSSRSRR
jgi:hypothetical protein